MMPRTARLREVACAAVIFALLLSGCGDVSHVSGVTVANSTDFPVDVDVSGEGRAKWLSLGSAEARSEVATRDVVDQGDVWVFRFDYLGAHSAIVETSRANLARAGWRVEVPQTLEEDIRDMGSLPPS